MRSRGHEVRVVDFEIRRAGLILSINEALRDYTIAMGAPRARTAVLPAGVDLDRYSNAGRSDARLRLGLNDDDLVLFYMGWFYSFSGLREVARAVLDSPTNKRVAKLVAIGRGELWDSLVTMASAADAAGRLVLESWRPYRELPSYLASADICLLPAYRVGLMENIVPIKM